MLFNGGIESIWKFLSSEHQLFCLLLSKSNSELSTQMSRSTGGIFVMFASSSLGALNSCFCGLYVPWSDLFFRATEKKAAMPIKKTTTRPTAAGPMIMARSLLSKLMSSRSVENDWKKEKKGKTMKTWLTFKKVWYVHLIC